MEKYSAFRDPGTGIQPFTTPIPSVGLSSLEKSVFPLRCVLGVVRTLVVLVLVLLYLLVQVVCLIFAPIPPLRRAVARIFRSIIIRSILLVVGLLWIPVDHVTRKRGRQRKNIEAWSPQAGDIIVSNWVSWVEVLWLAYRFNPIFVLPLTDTVTSSSSPPSPTATYTYRPGRRPDIKPNLLSRADAPSSERLPILGFREVSFLNLILNTGQVPPFSMRFPHSPVPLEEIRKKSNRPIVVFPECTTSNGKGLLCFANVFQGVKVPVRDYKVYVMCVRCDPPSISSPTLTHSIPSAFNPLPHLFSLTTSFRPLTISIRLLAPSESPSSPLFMVSDVVTNYTREDLLSEVCAALIAGMGKMRRTGMSWEDKATFLEVYRRKRK